MSKTTQENPTTENSAKEVASNTSKTRSNPSTSKTTTPKLANTPKTTSTSTTQSRRKSTISNTQSVKSTSKTESPVQQEKNMSQNTVRRVAIIGGNRIPFARSNGPYFKASNSDMLTAALNGLIEHFGLQGQRLGEVVAGQ